ncbi:MAG TPA: hypothetical protein VFV66_27305 [Nonomuraea sp.]|nr:hypothetical protein [Nonomuraea sp.]
MSSPPQTPPVRRTQLTDPYAIVDVTAATDEQLARVRARLLFSTNVNDPAAFTLPSYEQAKLAAA